MAGRIVSALGDISAHIHMYILYCMNAILMKRLLSTPERESRELNWWLDGHRVAYSWVVDS